MIEVYRALMELLDSGGAGAICTVVESDGSAPQKLGSKLLYREDGSTVGTVGGGSIEEATTRRAKEVASSGTPELLRADLARDLGMCCGGRMGVFIEPVGARPWLLVFGGGHVGAAVCDVATRAGFRVHVIDEREEVCVPERHPRAAMITCAPPLDVIPSLPWGPRTFAVVMTHAHRHDEAIVERCAALPRCYLGMIGSRAKVGRFLDRFRQKGLDVGLLADLRAPIGLDIAAVEPGEIAVAVVAEMVAVRRGLGARDGFPAMRLVPAG